MTGQVSTTFYAIVEPTFGTTWDPAAGRVDCVKSIKVTSILQNKPTSMKKGVAVKLTLRFNEQAFMPLAPVAVIDIPDSMVALASDIEVEAVDDNGAAVAQYLASTLRQP